MRGRLGNDRQRTTWTLEMDRYFVDLLLDQIKEGNMTDGHLFSGQAWEQMTTLFSAMFGSHFEMDVLKNRHKTLRILFRAVKKILDHEGFTWDEKSHIVRGDGRVWDLYLKKNPDARVYKRKAMPYYKKFLRYMGVQLSVEEVIRGKGDHGAVAFPEPADDGLLDSTWLGHETENAGGALQETAIDKGYRISASDLTEECSGPSTRNIRGSMSCRRTRTPWYPLMDQYFIDLMLKQIEKGNKIDGMFQKQAWADMNSSFNNKFGISYELDVLKNRYKTLRNQYNLIKGLLGLDGFDWDGTRQMVIADNRAWQDYIKTHRDARQYMNRRVPYFKDLSTIFRNQRLKAFTNPIPILLNFWSWKTAVRVSSSRKCFRVLICLQLHRFPMKKNSGIYRNRCIKL